MRKEYTKRPSFPLLEGNKIIEFQENIRWQVLCGDKGYYRIGVYSPEFSSKDEIKELEYHNCPEIFILIKGKINLILIEDNKLKLLPLEFGKPVYITAPHNGFCPDGPFTGFAIVIERDEFETEYRTIEEWLKI